MREAPDIALNTTKWVGWLEGSSLVEDCPRITNMWSFTNYREKG